MRGDPWAGSSRRRRTLAQHVLQTYGRTCHLCGRSGASTVDHLVPISKGGALWDPANLRPAHGTCNYMRGAMDLAEWFRRHPLPTQPALAPSRQW